MVTENYQAPMVEVLTVNIEKGFAASGFSDYANEGEAGGLQEGDSYDF